MPNPDRGIFWEFQTGPTEATWQRSVLDLEKRLDRFADRIRRGSDGLTTSINNIIEGTTPLSHSALEDLDVPGDHPWAFLHDGTRPATGDFDMDGFDIDMGGGDIIDANSVDIESTLPKLLFEETDQATDEKGWRIAGNSANLQFSTVDDSLVFGANAMILTRGTDTAVSQIDLFADLDMNIHDILNVGDAIQFDITSTPVIDQERAAADEDGVDMIVRSQQGGTVSDNGTFGGDLRLIGGDGYVDGDHSFGPGTVFLECGTGNVVGSLGIYEVNFYQPVKLNGDTLDTEDGDIELGTGQLTSDTAGVLFGDDADLQGNNLLDFGVLRTSGFTVAELPNYGASTPQGLAVVTDASTGVTLCVWGEGLAGSPYWIDLQTGSQVTT